VQSAGNQYPRASRDAFRHQHSFRRRRRAIPHRSVRDLLARQLAHEGLKLKDRLERALRDFRLIWRVRGQKFTALDDCVRHNRAKVVVDARSEKTRIPKRILRSTLFEILNDFRF